MESHQLEQCAGDLQCFMNDYKAFIVDGLKLIDDAFVILRSSSSVDDAVSGEMVALVPILSETLECWGRAIAHLRIPSDLTLTSWLKNRLASDSKKTDSGFSTVNGSGMWSQTDTPDSLLDSDHSSDSSSQFGGRSDLAQSVVKTVKSISRKLEAAISAELSSSCSPDSESMVPGESHQTANSSASVCENATKNESCEVDAVVGETKSITDLFKELTITAKPNSAFEPFKLKQDFNVKTTAGKHATMFAFQNPSKKQTEIPNKDTAVENYLPHTDASNRAATTVLPTSTTVETKTEDLQNNAGDVLPKQVRFSGSAEANSNLEVKSVTDLLQSAVAFEKSGTSKIEFRSLVFSPAFGRGFSKNVSNCKETGVGCKPEHLNCVSYSSQKETAKSPALNMLHDGQDEGPQIRKTGSNCNDESYSPALMAPFTIVTDSSNLGAVQSTPVSTYSNSNTISSWHPAFENNFSKQRSTRVRSTKIYSAGNHIVERSLSWRIDVNWPAWTGTSYLPERNMAPKYWCYLCSSVSDLPGSTTKSRFYNYNCQQHVQSLHGLLCHLTSRTHLRSLVAHVESGLPVQAIERKFWKEDPALQVYVYKIVRKQLAEPDREEIPLSPFPTEDYFVPFGPKPRPTKLAIGGACSTCFVRITNTFAEHAIVLRFESSTCSGRAFGSYLVKHEHTVLNGTHVAMVVRDFYLRPLQSVDFLVRYWPADGKSQVAAKLETAGDDSETETSNFLVGLGFLVSFEEADRDEASIKAMPKTVFLCFEGDSESCSSERHHTTANTQLRQHSSGADFYRAKSPVRVFGASKRYNRGQGQTNRAQRGIYEQWMK